MAGIEGYVLAKDVEALYLSKNIEDSKHQQELLEAYYLAKHAYEKIFSTEYFPKLRDIVDSPPSIKEHLRNVELEVIRRKLSKFEA